MNTDAGYVKIKKLIEAKMSTSPKFKALFKRIESGKATFKDTAEYSRLLSELYSKTFSDSVLELESASREEISTMLLHDTYDSTNRVLGQVQSSLDKKENINIRPQKAPFPAERVLKFSHSLQDVTVPDPVIQRRARSGTENITMSFHDDYMKENAEFRSKAGLKCYITRTTDGTCCEWCTKVAGRYEFGSQPEDIFRRHDNCNCEIDYDGQKLRGEMNGNSKKWIEVPAEGAGAEPPKVFTKEESAALSEKNKPVVFTKEQAKKLNDEKLKEIFVNKPSIDNSGESGIINTDDIYDLNRYEYIKPETVEEWKSNANHCSEDEYNQILGHRKSNGERGGYVRSHCAWEFNAKLREKGEYALDDDDRKTLETIRKLCRENVSDRNVILDRFVESDYLSEYSKPFDKYHEKSIDEVVAFINNNMLNSQKTEKSVVSASYNANVLTDRSVHICLFCPKGTHMFVTDNDRESEVLFHDGLTYEIISCEKEEYRKMLSQKYRLVLNVVVKNNGL